MYCGECGTKNEVGAKVCSKCGKSLGFDVKDFTKDVASNMKEKLKNISAKEGKTYFSARKYLSYAAYFQLIVWAIYILYILVGLGIGIAILNAGTNAIAGLFMLIISVAIAYGLAWITTLFLKIKIQNMRWKVDIHNTVVLKNKD